MESRAEEKKNLGNEEFKKGNFLKAAKLYTEALGKTHYLLPNIVRIDFKENEAIYTNRAASYIALKEYKKALEDCHLALNLNPSFGKAYKRMFKVYLCLGNLEVR
jgi:tetratricopeptide (TPR) repeat protein